MTGTMSDCTAWEQIPRGSLSQRLTNMSERELRWTKRGVDPQQLLSSLLTTANSLEVCVCSLHRAHNLADRLCDMTGYARPQLSVPPQFWRDLEQLRHSIEHIDERVSGTSQKQQPRTRTKHVMPQRSRALLLTAGFRSTISQPNSPSTQVQLGQAASASGCLLAARSGRSTLRSDLSKAVAGVEEPRSRKTGLPPAW